MATFNRNEWSISTETTGNFQPKRVATLRRNTHYTGRSRDTLLTAQLRLREMHRGHGPLHTIVAPLEVINEILEGMDQ